MMKIGLKLYSTDFSLIPEAKELLINGCFDFVELYVIPESYDNTIEKWKKFDVHYVIHAPHSFHGINFAQVDKWDINQKNFNIARRFSDILGSNTIIVHGGNDGSFDETIRQIINLKENRIILENKPKIGILDQLCVGWSPGELNQAVSSGAIRGIALDFGHAVCASVSEGVDSIELIKEFAKLTPEIYHLSDGNKSSEKDNHKNLGKGNFDLHLFFSVLPLDACITIETPRRASHGLADFVEDVKYIKNILI